MKVSRLSSVLQTPSTSVDLFPTSSKSCSTTSAVTRHEGRWVTTTGVCRARSTASGCDTAQATAGSFRQASCLLALLRINCGLSKAISDEPPVPPIGCKLVDAGADGSRFLVPLARVLPRAPSPCAGRASSFTLYIILHINSTPYTPHDKKSPLHFPRIPLSHAPLRMAITPFWTCSLFLSTFFLFTSSVNISLTLHISVQDQPACLPVSLILPDK
ncbi:hypothetical protein V8E36_006449 [Tilletia maclaganii]